MNDKNEEMRNSITILMVEEYLRSTLDVTPERFRTYAYILSRRMNVPESEVLSFLRKTTHRIIDEVFDELKPNLGEK